MPYLNQEIQLLQLIRLLRMAYQLYHHAQDQEQVIQNTIALIVFLFLLDALAKQVKLAARPTQTLSDAIKHTQKNPLFFSRVGDMTCRLSYVRPVEDDAMKWDYYYVHDKNEHYNIRMHLNDNTLLYYIKRFHRLSFELEQCIHASPELSLLDLPKPPKLYERRGIHALKPWIHISKGIDIPSKRRIWDLSFALRDIVVYLLRVVTLEKPALPIPALLTGLLTLREGYLLNEQYERLACQGIQRRIKPYYAFPPTCLGQQLGAQYFFVGDSQTLNQHTEFLIDMLKYVKLLESRVQEQEISIDDKSAFAACIDLKNDIMPLIQPALKLPQARTAHGAIL